MVQVTELRVQNLDLLFAEQAAHAVTKEKLRAANEALASTRLELTKVSRRLGEKRANAT